jgi:hypothetical protein
MGVHQENGREENYEKFKRIRILVYYTANNV